MNNKVLEQQKIYSCVCTSLKLKPTNSCTEFKSHQLLHGIGQMSWDFFYSEMLSGPISMQNQEEVKRQYPVNWVSSVFQKLPKKTFLGTKDI